MTARLQDFQFDTTTTYTLEFGTNYLRFYANQQQITLSGSPYEIWTPYAAADLFELQFEQINDVVYIAHKDHFPRKLTRYSDTDWTLESPTYTEPALLDENILATTITPSATTGLITLTASDAIFDSGHVGSFWRIGHQRNADHVTLAITANGTSSSIGVYGSYEIHTYGNWGAVLYLEKYDTVTSTWVTVDSFYGYTDSNGTGSRNVDGTGTADSYALYRLRIDNWTAGTDAEFVLEVPDSVVYGVVRITGFTSTTVVSAVTTVDLLATTATNLWSEGAWSTYRGFPRALCVHEQRLFFGGTSYQPATLWGSASDDLENFTSGGVADSDPVTFTLAGEKLNAVQWLASKKALLIGTSGSEWAVRGDETGQTIAPSRIDAKRQSSYGSEYIRAISVAGAVLFVERKGKKLREMIYSWEQQLYVARDLTLLAEHITEQGIKQMAWQSDRRILWVVMSDGTLASFTYELPQKVEAWARHPATNGTFLSVTTIYGDTTTEDEVWLVVERTLGGSAVDCIEMIDPDIFTTLSAGFFVDCGLKYSGTPATTFTGLDHLAGEQIAVLADGIVITGITVDSAGGFTLSTAASTVAAGLPFTSKVSPFRLDADSVTGITVGKNKRIDSVTMRLLKSAGLSYQFADGSVFDWIYPEDIRSSTSGDYPLVGSSRGEDYPIQIDAAHTRDPSITIIQDKPLPMSVLALAIGYTVSSD